MDEPKPTYEDEVKENQAIDHLVWDDVDMKEPLQSYQGYDQSIEEDSRCEYLEEKPHDPVGDENDCRDVVMDYTSEFTTHEVFKTREGLTTWLREVSIRNGFVVVVKSSQLTASHRRPVITFICERGRKYRANSKYLEGEPEKKKRNTGTKKCDCPFQLIGRMKTDEGWVLKVISGVHNHPAAVNLIGHSYAGRLKPHEKELLVELSKNLVRPRDILRTIKNRDATNISTLRHIYNLRHRMRILEMSGRSQMQHLMHKLAEHNYIEWHRSSGESNELVDLFWTHPFNLDLLRTFPIVLLMDCTYKTNRYNLPLFEIVGETSTGKTFMVAFAYLHSEREDNYHWVLDRLKTVMHDIEPPKVIVTDRELALMNAVKTVFPEPATKHLLCRWHINKNVEAECKQHFHIAADWEEFMVVWGQVMMSDTECKYYELLAEFKKRFSSHPLALDYVLNSWLDPYKERFVEAWTDQHMHLGNKTTNRAESQHAKLKRQLQSSQCNFATSFINIHALLDSQHDDILASFEKSLTIVQHAYNPAQFKEVRGVVSITALNLLLKSRKHATRVSHYNETKCTCALRHTHGLPCGHEIARYQKEGRPIPLSCIHDIWKRLSITRATMNEDSGCIPELNMLASLYKRSDATTRIQLLMKMRELACPESTSLMEPKVKTNNKGRPPKGKGKIDTSSKRDPSKFEYIESGQVSLSPVPSNVFVSQGRGRGRCRGIGRGRCRGRGRGRVAPGVGSSIDYLDQFNPQMVPFISEIKDVEPDGHCGFRAIAGLLGFGEDQWPRVRKDLLQELQTHPNMYAQLLRLQNRVEEVTCILDYYGSIATSQYWFTFPEMGYLAASCYGCVLHLFHKYQSLTFLPLRVAPIDIKKRKVIAMGYVNGNHFVQVFLQSDYPYPPVCADWYKNCEKAVEPWADPYQDQIDSYRAIVEPPFPTGVVINLND